MTYKYHPILRIQKGECEAISKLKDDIVESVNPLWEIPPIPQRPRKDGGGDKYSTHEHIKLSLEKVLPAMSLFKSLKLDANLFDEYVINEDGEEIHTLDLIQEIVETSALNFIPVVTLESTREYIEAANRHSENGMCLRLNISNLNSDTIVESCEEIYECISTEYKDTDLIFDAGSLTLENKNSFKERLVLSLMQLNGLSDWSSLSLVSSSYLASMSGVEKDKIVLKPLLELELWNELRRIKNLPRLPEYGDYALSPAELDYSTPVEFMNPAATIRYSDTEYWIFVKGEQVKGKGGNKGPGWAQTQHLCQILVETHYFKQFGPSFSYGDGYIAQRATNDVKCGAGYTWKGVGINHHTTMITKHLSNLSAPS